MRRPAVFFDRDNTLIANDGYLGDASRVQLVEGAADAVAKARDLGYAAVVFSNQSGVARGMFSEEAVHAVNARMDELLHDHHPAAVIDRHEFCPYHPEASVERYRQESDLRKPKPGMIRQAAEKLALDLSRSWVIGDAPRDIEAGKAAGCRTILVKNPELPPSPAAAADGENGDATAAADFVVASLKEATDVIERNPSPPAAEGESVPDDDRRHVAGASTAGTEEVIDAEVEPVAASASSSTPAGRASPAVEQAVPTPPTAAPASPESNQNVSDRQKPAALRLSAEDPAPIPVLPMPRPRPTDAGGKEDETPPAPGGTERLENLAEQIIQELRARHEQSQTDFSVSKMLAGITQVIALAAVFFAYLRRDTPGGANAPLLVAQFLQTLTISLLIMGRQR